MAMPRTLAALLLITIPAPLVFSACEVETQREVEPDGNVDVERELELDEDAKVEARNAASKAEEGLEAVGEDVREGAARAGEEIREAAKDVHDAVDSNVDLGDNAENQ